MTVRAKFRCQSIEKRLGYSYVQSPAEIVIHEVVKLSPVSGDANKQWSQATPSGQVEMAITNPAAVAQFEVGKCYYLDFTPAPEVDTAPTADLNA